MPVREMMMLTADWSYASRNFAVPFTFTIPGNDELGRWRMLFDTSNYLILTLKIADKVEPDVSREEPGASFHALPETMTTEQFLESWTAYAAEQEEFAVEISDGAYLGSPATVISGTYKLGDPTQGAFPIRLGDAMTVPVASGERQYLSYLVPVGERTVMVSVNADERDFDLIVTLVNQIVESVDFL